MKRTERTQWTRNDIDLDLWKWSKAVYSRDSFMFWGKWLYFGVVLFSIYSAVMEVGTYMAQVLSAMAFLNVFICGLLVGQKNPFLLGDKDFKHKFSDDEIKKEIETYNTFMGNKDCFEFYIKSLVLKDKDGLPVTAQVFKTSHFYISQNSVNDKNMFSYRYGTSVDFLKKGWVVDCRLNFKH